MLVVWDSLSATPVRTFLNPHPNGVKTMDLSSCKQYIATLGADTPQTISLWDWTDEKQDGPICSLEFQYTEEKKVKGGIKRKRGSVKESNSQKNSKIESLVGC